MFWTKAAYWMATGFGLGFSPVAPGTVGCLLGVPLVLVLNRYDLWIQIVAALLLSLLAIPICQVGERSLKIKDPHPVVADEYLTFPICMLGLPVSWAVWWVLPMAFVTNRIFDIVKPPPARQLQELSGGLGIVIDDVFSALYSLAANHLLFRLVSGWL